MINTIDEKEKIFNRWIDTISGQHDQEYRSIASINSIGIIHRSIADCAHLCQLDPLELSAAVALMTIRLRIFLTPLQLFMG